MLSLGWQAPPSVAIGNHGQTTGHTVVPSGPQNRVRIRRFFGQLSAQFLDPIPPIPPMCDRGAKRHLPHIAPATSVRGFDRPHFARRQRVMVPILKIRIRGQIRRGMA